MGRKRIDLGTDADARILAMMRRSATATEVAQALSAATGRTVSPRTAQRRMTELRGREQDERRERVQARAPASAPRVDEVPDAVPDDAPLELVNKWIAKVEAAAEAAETEGDLRTFATIAAKLVTLLEHRRKATPPPVADPNEHPDMVALAEDVRERLHKMIEQVAT